MLPLHTLLLFFLFLLLLLLFVDPWIAAAHGHCTTTTKLQTYNKCMNLPTQDASIAWTYHAHNATLQVAFLGSFISPSGWVGWGINPTSPEMTGARVLIAFSNPTSGGLLVLPYILDPSVKFQRGPLTSRPLDLPLLASSAALHAGSRSLRDGAQVEIHATLKLVPNRTRIHHVWNRGLYVQGYSPTIHATSPADLASHATIDVVSTAATMAPAMPDWLRPTHAILNSISWGFFLPVGVVVARYLRQCSSAGPAWFYAHASIQILGFMVGTMGFAIGIIMGAASTEVVYGLHKGLGTAAVVLGGLQSLALLFRPKETHKFRKYWKSYHHLVGYGCVVIGVVNVFQGLEVMGLGDSYAKLAYSLALSTLVGFCIALEVNAWVVFCRNAQVEKMRREGAVVQHHVVKGSAEF